MLRRYMMLLTVLILVPTAVHAELVPRIAYVVPTTDGQVTQPSYMGKYWYLGVGFLNTAGGGLIGPSIRYGFGETGKKLNISYLAGGQGISLEGGVAYIEQSRDATLFVDQSLKGFAFEASLRYGISTAIFITNGKHSSVEFALGF